MAREITYRLDAVKNFRLLNFATGSYSCTCSICGDHFIGDKRAVMCLGCAIKAAEEKFTSNNIDYAAALREIEELLIPGRFTMRKKIMYIESVVSRLNSQKKDCELRII